MKQWLISPLDKTHDRKSFFCGIDSLDNYLQKQARQDSQKRIAVTYVLHEQRNGFFTLTNEVPPYNKKHCKDAAFPTHFFSPAIALSRSRLGVCEPSGFSAL